MTVLEHYGPHIAQHAAEHVDDAACRRLWEAVIQCALRDLRYQARFAGQRVDRHERTNLREIAASPPEEFVAGPWFEVLCGYLGVDASVMRARLREDVEGAA